MKGGGVNISFAEKDDLLVSFFGYYLVFTSTEGVWDA